MSACICEFICELYYLGVRIGIPSNATTASSPPTPTSAIDMILSRKNYTGSDWAHQPKTHTVFIVINKARLSSVMSNLYEFS